MTQSEPTPSTDGAVPTYLLDRAQEKTAKQLSSMVKQKRKEAAARFSVPLPKVRGMAEEEVFKVLKTGKSKGKSWKRVITKPTFVGEGFTRRPVKVCTVVEGEQSTKGRWNGLFDLWGWGWRRRMSRIGSWLLQCSVLSLEWRKIPTIPCILSLAYLREGYHLCKYDSANSLTIIEVDVSSLGLVTAGGKVVWGKYAQITNNPGILPSLLLLIVENDGCVNALLLG